MVLKKNILFIINPISGGKSKRQVPALIEKYIDKQQYNVEIIFSQTDKQITELSIAGAKTNHVIVAVGGDGTVNETGTAIAGTHTILGILPFGSGNGLARYLQIPMDTIQAIKNLNLHRVEHIDAAKMNDNWFFNMAGMGFDAHISEVFSHGLKRGFQTYISSSVREIKNYKAQHYCLNIDGNTFEREAFMLSFANSSQYGNNAHVSPFASLHDGLVDVCVIKPFPVYKLPEMGMRMFTKTAHLSPYVEIIKGRHIFVKRDSAGPVHFDGEPRILGADAEINAIPATLAVIVGSAYQKLN